jgi:hypothetical protein
MQLAMARATVGRANTTHIVLVEVLENNAVQKFGGVHCGSRVAGTGFYIGEKLTRTIDTDNEKFYTLYPEVIEALSGTRDVVCEKCYARAVA